MQVRTRWPVPVPRRCSAGAVVRPGVTDAPPIDSFDEPGAPADELREVRVELGISEPIGRGETRRTEGGDAVRVQRALGRSGHKVS